MHLKRLTAISTLSSLFLAGVIGCEKRKETITVHHDGRVAMDLEYEGDSREELFDGDAVPRQGEGWTVAHSVKTKENGDETHTLAATKLFPPGAALPDNYANPGDADQELCLQFPTTLRTEKREDGTYYHFRREYLPRPSWTKLNAFRRAELEGISEKDPKDMTYDERVKGVKALVGAELIKMRTFALAAFREVTPEAAQDHWLAVHEALARYRDEVDYARLASLMENRPAEMKGERDENTDDELAVALEEESRNMEITGMSRIQEALGASSGYDTRQIAEFRKTYDRYKRQYDISEDLGDDAFEIIVVMPGVIVASNADEQEENAVKWEFDGEQVRDGGAELMVTSRVNN